MKVFLIENLKFYIKIKEHKKAKTITWGNVVFLTELPLVNNILRMIQIYIIWNYRISFY